MRTGARLSLRRAVVAAFACSAAACGLGTSGLLEIADDASTTVTPNGSSGGQSSGGGSSGGESSGGDSSGGPTPTSDAASSADSSGGDSSSSLVDSNVPLVDSGPPIPDSGPPDVHVLDPDAAYADSGDPCDLDEDGVRATGTCGGTDCCDFDGRAYPGETSYFATTDACGSFDYNCNATNEPEYALANCALSGFGCKGDGFDKAPPPCGASATFDSCNYNVFFCGTSQSSKAQACR